MNGFWFRPRRYGYGAAPIAWQGWALVGFSAAIVLLCVLNLTFGERSLGNWITSVLVVAIVTAATVRISRLKTDGAWAWRRGDHN
jgi:hypothetical protein